MILTKASIVRGLKDQECWGRRRSNGREFIYRWNSNI